MKKRSILEMKQVDKLISILRDILSEEALNTVQNEKIKHCIMLIELGIEHFEAIRLMDEKKYWRQIVSRCYYCCYSCSRAVRLAKDGIYDDSVEDHKKVGKLPKDFPDFAEWEQFLFSLRKDRNDADYVHDIECSMLDNSIDEIKRKTQDFKIESLKYIKGVEL